MRSQPRANFHQSTGLSAPLSCEHLVSRYSVGPLSSGYLSPGCRSGAGITGRMRSAVAYTCLLASLIVAAPASASECPGNPGALGTSRTIVVDPSEHSLLGGYQYRESLPLNDKEVVITFDDGPLPPYSTRILDILAQECVKATFFMVGRMARSFPQARAPHPRRRPHARQPQPEPSVQFPPHVGAATPRARSKAAFHRSRPRSAIPPRSRRSSGSPACCGRIWSSTICDRSGSWPGASTSWPTTGRASIRARSSGARSTRLEAKGKGILLLHDIQPATALGLPELLRELKARGYRVVHVVPSDRRTPGHRHHRRPMAGAASAEPRASRAPRAERVAARPARIACVPRRPTHGRRRVS